MQNLACLGDAALSCNSPEIQQMGIVQMSHGDLVLAKPVSKTGSLRVL
jgi:hypothetical protein